MIRPFREDDCRATAELELAAMLTWGVEIKTSLEKIEKSIMNESKTTSVAIEDGLVVGFVAWQPELASFCPSPTARDSDAHVAALFVHPSQIGTGKGRALILLALQQIRDAGFQSVRLWCPYCAERAHHLYEENGFLLTGNQTEYLGITRLERWRSHLAT